MGADETLLERLEWRAHMLLFEVAWAVRAVGTRIEGLASDWGVAMYRRKREGRIG